MSILIIWNYQRIGSSEVSTWKSFTEEDFWEYSDDSSLTGESIKEINTKETASKTKEIKKKETDSKEKAATGTSTQKKRYSVRGLVEQIWLEEEQVRIRLNAGEDGTVLLFLEAETISYMPKIGNRLHAVGELWEFREVTVPGQFDECSYYQANGYDLRIQADKWQITDSSIIWWRQKLWQFRQSLLKVYERLLPAEKAGVLSAMLLGEKRKLDLEIKSGYQVSGISHLLAVSGLHVSLLGGVVLYLLRKLRWPWPCPRLLADSVAILLILSYGILVDYPVSTSRAVIMIVLSVVAGMAGRTYDMPTALSCAMLLLVLQEPAVFCQAGFQLSFGAVLGIWLLYPGLEEYIENKLRAERKVLRGGTQIVILLGTGVWKGLLTSLSVLLATLPVQMYHFYEISLPGLWNNLLVLPVMPLLLITGVVGGLLGLLPGAIGVVLGRFFLGSAGQILQFYEWVCSFGRLTEWAVQITGRPEIWQIGFYYGLLGGWILVHRSRKRKRNQPEEKEGLGVEKHRRFWTLLLPAVTVAVLLLRFPEIQVTFLDVGQGDGIVIQSGRNTFLVDCGSSNISEVGSRRLIPFLKQEGIRRIEGAFVTHMDGDHISGLLELLAEKQISVASLFLPAVYREQETLQDERYKELVQAATEHGAKLSYLEPGDKIQDQILCITCLGPAATQPCTEQNAASLILKVSIQDTSLLLTGDMGTEEEEWLMAAERSQTGTSEQEISGFDILKVGHHGSKYSSGKAFLQWCKAKTALISCAAKNRYGHPHADTMKRLSEAGYQILGTAWSGSIQLRWEKNGAPQIWHYSR